MNYALQVHDARYIFPIPDGLKELSSDIIREVLRHQPEHINGFIADYLETMLVVREHARDSTVVVCDVFREGYFFDELFKTKNVTREQANFYCTIIQAAWRGYVVRKKLSEWLKKKKKFEEEKDRKRSLKIEELLAGLGITYDEATRAAGIIQTAYKESRPGKWVSNEFGDIWIEESIPLGERIRETDRIQGRYDRWEKEDFGDFFEMDEVGAIKYIWPKVGQLLRIPREEIPNDVDVVEFFGMRDLQGEEQYSYLIKPKSETQAKEVPIGFLIPVPKSCVLESTPEIEFLNAENSYKMGPYTYIFRDDVEREDLEKFDELLRAQARTSIIPEILGEFDYDPHWVLPRVLVRLKSEFLKEEDDEVRFVSLPTVVCEQESYTFKAESFQQSAKIIRHILRDKCLTVQQGLIESANKAPYKIQETGRIFPVEAFSFPSFIQKIEIEPESSTGEEEALNLTQYSYIFVPVNYPFRNRLPKGESPMKIPITRFQGYHTDYKGSAALQNKVFIMGPKLTTPDGKPFTYESLFWDEFGSEAWYRLLHNISTQTEQMLGEVEATATLVTEDEGKPYEEIGEEYLGEKVSIKIKAEKVTKKQSVLSEPGESLQTYPEASEIRKISPPLPPPTEKSLEVEGEEKIDLRDEEENEPDKVEEMKTEDDPLV